MSSLCIYEFSFRAFCSIVYLFLLNQDRAWRIGSKKDVHVYRLLSANSVEENIYQRQVLQCSFLLLASFRFSMPFSHISSC
jgi:hypothetical protein